MFGPGKLLNTDTSNNNLQQQQKNQNPELEQYIMCN